jgi:hypothetical protein
MAITSYDAVHRKWDHVGNLVPNFEHSEGDRPHIHGAPAPWLPVQYYDKHFEIYITIMAGKLVGLARDEWVIPAGLKVAWAAAAGGDTILTYAAADVAELVTDLTTGEAVAAATSYSKAQVTAALKERGLIESTENCNDYLSRPIGVAAQCMYAWGFTGSGDPAGQNFATYSKFHNFYMQSKVAVLCDYALRLPHVPSVHASAAIPAALTAGTPAFGDGNLYNATRTKSIVRYSDLTGSNFIALFAADFPHAANTAQTPLTASSSTLLVTKKSGPDALTQSGDYWVDEAAGVYFFYVSGGATIPANVTGTLTWYGYDAAPATVSDYVSAVGDIKPGDFLECDANSNFVLATNTSFRDIMGQALTSVRHPKDYLDRVRTGYAGFGVMDQMPGTASAGLPDNLTYSGASDKELVINLISR